MNINIINKNFQIFFSMSVAMLNPLKTLIILTFLFDYLCLHKSFSFIAQMYLFGKYILMGHKIEKYF